MKYHKQINDYTCGSTALVNVMKDFGIELTEKYIRRLLGTDRSGTTEDDLLRVSEDFDFITKEVKSKSIAVFKRKLVKDLKEGNKLIMCVDNNSHWISVLEYKDRRIKLVDSRYKDDLGKKIVQWLTVKQLTDRSHNFDLETNVKEFYYIALKLAEDN